MGLSDLLAGGGYPVTPTDPEYGNLVERDAPADLDFKRLLAGRGKQFQRDEFVSRPVDVSNTETSVAQVSPGTPQPDPGALRGDDGVFKPTNPQRGALIDSATKRLTELVNSPNPIFYKAQAAKAQEIATLTALLRGAEAQSWQEQAGADIPDERRARVETARARAAEARARAEALVNPKAKPPQYHPVNGSLLRVADDGTESFVDVPAKPGKVTHKEYRVPSSTGRGLDDVVRIGYDEDDNEVSRKTVMTGVSRIDIPGQAALAGATATARETAQKPFEAADKADAKKERYRTQILNLEEQLAKARGAGPRGQLKSLLGRLRAEAGAAYPGEKW